MLVGISMDGHTTLKWCERHRRNTLNKLWKQKYLKGSQKLVFDESNLCSSLFSSLLAVIDGTFASLSRFICWNPGLWVVIWSSGRSPYGVSALIKDTPESTPASLLHVRKLDVSRLQPRRGSRQNSTLLAPWSQAFGLQKMWEINVSA